MKTIRASDSHVGYKLWRDCFKISTTDSLGVAVARTVELQRFKINYFHFHINYFP